MFIPLNRIKLSVLSAAAGLLLTSSLANATVYTLSTWNTDELQSSNDTVTVIAGSGTSAGFTCQANQICVHWNDGVGTDTPTVKAIIVFSYNKNGSGTAPQTISETGGSTFWDFNDGAGNADGFGLFEQNNDKGNGNETTAGTTNWLVFGFSNGALPSDFSNWDFAAHVQYNDNCSGWVSDRSHSDPGSNSNCYTGPGRTTDNVPEPSSMILFGAGLIGLSVWRKKRMN